MRRPERSHPDHSPVPASPRRGDRLRRGTRRSASLLAALALGVIGAVGPVLPAAAAGSPTPSATAVAGGPADSGDVSVTVGVGTDGVLQPNQDLVLAVAVTNGTTRSLTDARVSVAVDSDTIDSRGELTDWFAGDDDMDTDELGDGAEVRLLPSSTSQLSITIPAADIPFSGYRYAEGTHALEVTVTADDETVATARGSMEWWPGDPVETPTGVAVVVPIVVPDTVEGLISSDDLAGYTDVTGTLTRQLDSIDGRQAAIGVDPRIIASIRILGPSAPASALAWLQRLESVPNEKFPLQYGDADVSAQAQSGLGALLGPTSFEYAIDTELFAAPVSAPTDPAAATSTPVSTPESGTGQDSAVAPESGVAPAPEEAPGSEAGDEPSADEPSADEPSGDESSTDEPSTDDTDELGPRPTLESLTAFPWTPAVGSLAWPAAGTVRGADLGVYTASGITRTIVSSSGLELPDDIDTATTATVDGAAVAIDDTALSRAFDTAVEADTDAHWRAAMTTLASETAQVHRSEQSGRVLVALERDAAIGGHRLSQTLDALEGLPWADGTSLSAALTEPQTDDVAVIDSPESQARLDRVARILRYATDIDTFSRVLDEPTLLTGRFRNDALALLGVSWRSDAGGWAEAVEARLQVADDTMRAVTIEAPDSVLQVSRDSSIPVYVRNDLPWPVTVVLRASTSNAVLDIDEGAVETTSIDAGSQGRVSIPVKARVGNGETRLILQVAAADGTPVGESASIVANVRADWETVGTLVIGIVLVVVFGLGIGRNILRRRRSGGGPPDDEPDPNALLAVQPLLGPIGSEPSSASRPEHDQHSRPEHDQHPDTPNGLSPRG